MAGAFAPRGGPVPQPRPEDFQSAEDYYNALWGATGIPLMQEGYGDVQGAFTDEGAWTDVPIGAGKMAMGALPYGGAISRAALATLPRTAAVLGALGFTTGLTGEAEAARRKAAAQLPAAEPPIETAAPITPSAPPAKPTLYELAAERDPRAKLALDAFRAATAQSDADMARLSDAYRKEASRGKAGPLAADIQRQIGEAQEASAKRLAPLQEKLDAAVAPYLPFDQRFPALSQGWTGIQIAVPMLTALATRGAGRAILNAPRKALNRSVQQAEKALDKGKVAVADRKIAEATRRIDKMDTTAPTSGGNFLTDVATPAIAGTGIGAELSMLPEQYNKRNTLPGTEDNRLATERLAPENILRTAAPGMILGGLGGFTAGHLPGRAVFPNVEGARALGQVAGPEAGGAAGYLMRSKESERALRALDEAPLPAVETARLPAPASVTERSAFARAEPEVLTPQPTMTERFRFGQPAPSAPSEVPMVFGPQSWPPSFGSPASMGELVPAASRSVAPKTKTAQQSKPAEAAPQSTAAEPIVDRSRTKARTRLWDGALARAEAAKTKQQAIDEIRSLTPNAGMSGSKVGVTKRRMIKAIEQSKGKSGRDWRADIEALRDDLKSKGLYGVSAAGIGASAVTQKREVE